MPFRNFSGRSTPRQSTRRPYEHQPGGGVARQISLVAFPRRPCGDGAHADSAENRPRRRRGFVSGRVRTGGDSASGIQAPPRSRPSPPGARRGGGAGGHYLPGQTLMARILRAIGGRSTAFFVAFFLTGTGLECLGKLSITYVYFMGTLGG